jgi:hypothetical protein
MCPGPNALGECSIRPSLCTQVFEAWKTPGGWRYWSAVNNTEVGLRYTAVAFFYFLFAGVLALLMRIQLLQLELFKAEQHGGSSYAHLMRHVATRLSRQQMRDVAAYYAGLQAARDARAE